MAKGVALSFKENFKKFNDILKENNLVFPDERIRIADQDLKEYYPRTYKLAYDQTIRDTHEAVAGFVYNINSMHSRGCTKMQCS